MVDCKYCLAPFSVKAFPYSLPCKCLICSNCANNLSRNQDSACFLCKMPCNPNNITQNNQYFTKLSQFPDYKTSEDKLLAFDREIDHKIELIQQIIKEKKKSLNAAKAVLPYFNSIRKVKMLAQSESFNNFEEKLAFINENQLMKLEDETAVKTFADKHFYDFTKTIYDQILQSEKLSFGFSGPKAWIGDELTATSVVEKTEVCLVSQDGDVKIEAIGVIKGKNYRQDNVRLQVVEIITANKKVFSQTFNNSLLESENYIADLNISNDVTLEQGKKCKIQFVCSSGSGIVMKPNKNLIGNDFSLRVSEEHTLLAYLRIKKIN